MYSNYIHLFCYTLSDPLYSGKQCLPKKSSRFCQPRFVEFMRLLAKRLCVWGRCRRDKWAGQEMPHRSLENSSSVLTNKKRHKFHQKYGITKVNTCEVCDPHEMYKIFDPVRYLTCLKFVTCVKYTPHLKYVTA